MTTTTGWLVSALVASFGLQLLGRTFDVLRRPVNPTARAVRALPRPGMSGPFTTLELPGVMLMILAGGLLLPQIGWSWAVTLYLVLLLAGVIPTLLHEQLESETTRTFTQPAVAVR